MPELDPQDKTLDPQDKTLGLQDKMQKAVTMRILGQTWDEVSAETGVPVHQVKKWFNGSDPEFRKIMYSTMVASALERTGGKSIKVIEEALDHLQLKDRVNVALSTLAVLAKLTVALSKGGDNQSGGDTINQFIVLAPELAAKTRGLYAKYADSIPVQPVDTEPAETKAADDGDGQDVGGRDKGHAGGDGPAGQKGPDIPGP